MTTLAIICLLVVVVVQIAEIDKLKRQVRGILSRLGGEQ